MLGLWTALKRKKRKKKEKLGLSESSHRELGRSNRTSGGSEEQTMVCFYPEVDAIIFARMQPFSLNGPLVLP